MADQQYLSSTGWLDEFLLAIDFSFTHANSDSTPKTRLYTAIHRPLRLVRFNLMAARALESGAAGFAASGSVPVAAQPVELELSS